MDLHPGEQIVFEGHPSWRGLLSFYVGGVAGALDTAGSDDSEFRFLGIDRPEQVVAAVDRAQRDAAASPTI
jgi:hypothetical protein